MAVEGTVICKSQVAEDRGVIEQLFDIALCPAHEPRYGLSHQGYAAQGVLNAALCLYIAGLCAHICQISRKRPHVFGDGHGIVVEYDDEVPPELSGVIQPLKGQPARKGPVADDGHHVAVVPLQTAGFGKAQGRGNGCAAVAAGKAVAGALLPVGKTG